MNPGTTYFPVASRVRLPRKGWPETAMIVPPSMPTCIGACKPLCGSITVPPAMTMS